ncbi:MAG: VOC family protein [Acidobacteria bacterium]|mgnify:CR=1 FL=1|nr:VOC family protein [Acidobacteriota bacterium]
MHSAKQSNVRFVKIATQFAVDDVVATAEYYRDIFGFEILGYFAEPPVYAMVERGGVEMHFGEADRTDRDASESEFRRVGFDAYIWVDDIEGLNAEMADSGADIIEGPVKRVYGSTEVVVRDPNGFILVFGD